MIMYWACPTCGATGHTDRAYKSDTANPDYKHLAGCTGMVLTGVDEAALGRIAARVAAR